MKKYLSAITLLMIFAVTLLSACGSGSAGAIEKRWEIRLPNDMTELYHADSWGWFGDGDAYTVFTPKAFTAEYFQQFANGKYEGYAEADGSAWFTAFEAAVSELAEGLQVPYDYLPDFSGKYFVGNCADGEEVPTLAGVSILWTPNDGRIIVIERRS